MGGQKIIWGGAFAPPGAATTCKKRSLTSFVALVSFENLYKLLLHKVGMFRIKTDKTCIKA